MFFTTFTVFGKKEFFFLLNFIFHRDVVLALANLTDESDKNAFLFFGHAAIIEEGQSIFNCQSVLSRMGAYDYSFLYP